jgi:DNA-directed RNA polymerase sigma subunit (sigma70/sigma32)
MNILDYILLNFSQKEIDIYRKIKLEKVPYDIICKEYGITKNRVRQIQEKTITKTCFFNLDVKVSIKKTIRNGTELSTL